MRLEQKSLAIWFSIWLTVTLIACVGALLLAGKLKARQAELLAAPARVVMESARQAAPPDLDDGPGFALYAREAAPAQTTERTPSTAPSGVY